MTNRPGRLDSAARSAAPENASGSEPPEVLLRLKRRLARRPFRPHWLIPGPHLQTVIGSKLKRRFPRGYRRAPVDDIEIAEGVAVRTVEVLRDADAPSLIILHGMSGGSDSGYMRGLSHKAWRMRWNAFLPNLYNVHPKPVRPVIFHAGSSRLAEALIRTLVERRRLGKVFLVGASMGANILLKLLAEWGGEAPAWLRAAAAVSPLCDLTTSWRIMERPVNRPYQAYFASRLRNIARRQADHFAGAADMERVLKIRTIREFDEHCTAPVAGYENAFHYYEACSSMPILDRIRVPTAVLHSKDDPFLPWEPFTTPQARGNPALGIHLTERGGHLGFLESDGGGDWDRRWVENRVLDFFRLANEIR